MLESFLYSVTILVALQSANKIKGQLLNAVPFFSFFSNIFYDTERENESVSFNIYMRLLREVKNN